MASKRIHFRTIGAAYDCPCVGSRTLPNELLVPELENQQRPDLLIARKPALLLHIQNLFNRLMIEKFHARRITRRQSVPHKISKLVSEPRLGGHGKAFL